MHIGNIGNNNEYIEYYEIIGLIIEFGDKVLLGQKQLSKLSEYKDDSHVKHKKDLVTEYDKIIEQDIGEYVVNKGGCLYGEEFGRQGKKNLDNYYIIDPIDGTTDFVYGGDERCITIAHIINGNIHFGLIYIPARQCCYLSKKGQGVTKIQNNQQSLLGKSKYPNFSETLISYVQLSEYKKDAIISSNFHPIVRRIRSCNSIAFDLCKIIEGYYSMLIGMESYFYDYAAGLLMLTELGGFAIDHAGKLLQAGVYYDNILFVGSQEIYDAFQKKHDRKKIQSDATEEINISRLGTLLS